MHGFLFHTFLRYTSYSVHLLLFFMLSYALKLLLLITQLVCMCVV